MTTTTALYTCDNPRAYSPDEEFLVTVKELEPKVLERAETFDHSDELLYTIVLPYSKRDMPVNDLKKAINYVYSSHGCDHEYDCCGCTVAQAWTHTLKRVRRGVYSFRMSVGKNY